MTDRASPAAFDRAALDELNEMTGGDAAFMAELIDTFLADGTALVSSIRTAVASGDAAELRRAAHTLKSNSRTFGASTLGDLCQQIEEQAATGNLDGMAILVGRAEVEYPSVVAALRAERPAA